jgi:hypothetical protein
MSTSTVTSEALQLKLRQLLPSQQGFGTDLTASDTIIPIIDLTAAAEGSDVPEFLQTALAFGNQTSFTVTNTTTTIASTAGFYRIIGTSNIKTDSASTISVVININDGVSDKQVWGQSQTGSGTGYATATSYDFVAFLRPGDSLKVTTNDVEGIAQGSVRQVADVNGVLVVPTGFTPQ